MGGRYDRNSVMGAIITYIEWSHLRRVYIVRKEMAENWDSLEKPEMKEEKKPIKKGRKEISRRNNENIKGWCHRRQESRDFKK